MATSVFPCLKLHSRWASLVVVTMLLAFQPCPVSAQAVDEDAAKAQAEIAVNAQNAGEFPFAAEQWELVLKDYPNSVLKGLAEHNLGVCYSQMGMRTLDPAKAKSIYLKANDVLARSLESLGKDETDKLARSLLFLGFSQSQLGKNALETSSPDSKKWFLAAVDSFDKMQKNYPGFPQMDQAWFFQGEAYESVGNFEKAAASYAKAIEYKDSPFKYDTILALGSTQEQLGNFKAAIANYDRFRKEAEGAGGHELLTESVFRKAETLLKMATAVENTGQSAGDLYAQAEQLFGNAADDVDFSMGDLARFQQAFCANRQQQFEKAGNLYQQVANIKGTNLANRALVYAGRDYVSAGKVEAANRALVNALKTETEYSAEAAHWLAQLQLRTNKNLEAFNTASEWIGKTKSDKPRYVSLLLDRADAAYIINEKRAESPAFYLQIPDQFPKHNLAPTALYNASFAFLEIGKFKEAIELVKRFEKEYASSDYLADALEVKADSHLLLNEAPEAEAVFSSLVQSYPQHEKVATWNLRRGLAQYMQDKYREVLEGLGQQTELFKDKAQLAEANHWIGASQLKLKQYPAAIESLKRAFDTDSKWRRADETLTLLAQAQSLGGEDADSEATTQMLVTRFPKSGNVAQSVYRMGESAYAKRDFESALKHYSSVVNTYPESELVPHALYGAGWSAIEQKQFTQAIQLFDRLINQHSEHERAPLALIGRGVCKRQAGEPKKAVEDFEGFLKTNPQGQSELDAMYEMGLAQVDLADWPNVVETFQTLIDKAPQSKLMDRFHYELGWAHKKSDNATQATRHFGTVATKYQDSPLAPEANFHVANAAYDDKEYGAAAEAYTNCVKATTNDSLKEKAIYKLGWCHYKQKDFDKSLRQFQQQIDLFPEGELKADGLLMVSDSLYRMEKYEQAVEAYRVASPAMKASKTVSKRIQWQAMLHGSQSANKAKRFDQAIEFAQPIVESSLADPSFKQDAHLEIGKAWRGKKQFEEAVQNWTKAAANTGETGAEARCMIGEVLYEQKKFDEAIKAFKMVFYGYGGTQSAPEIKPWQAFAVFEAAQCNFVRIKEASPEMRAKYVSEAMKLYQFLVKNYPQDQLVEQSRKRIQTLQRLSE